MCAQDNYFEDVYREMYSGASYSNYASNPNFVLHRQEGDTSASKAGARIVRSVLGHFVACQSGNYPPLKTKVSLKLSNLMQEHQRDTM